MAMGGCSVGEIYRGMVAGVGDAECVRLLTV